MKKRILFSLLLPALVVSHAEEESTPAEEQAPAEGHSYHGEVFNEGPRQAAVLIPGTGDVSFPVTTKSEEAQKFFDQGVGQLHGFWDFEAERSFRQVAAIDPDCAMAYWGMAMANFKNNARGKGFIEEAVERKEKVSEREQLWIEGLAEYFKDPKADQKKRLREFVRSIEEIAMENPDDIEAQAFLMKQIYYNHGKGLAIPSHYAINLLAEKILTADPDHPANHYQIHLWDRETPEKALKAAANCGPAAPGIAHMWHMPGHIYSKLQRYADATWQQEASARIDHAHMMRFQIVPDQIHNFAHNNEWCIRNFDFLGQHSRSVELATNMISLPRLAKFKKEDDDSTFDPGRGSWQYGRQRLRDTLVRYEQWEELIRQSENGLLVVDEKSITQKDHDRFVGIAKFESGDLSGGQEHLAALTKILDEKTAKRDKAMADAETKAKNAKKKESEIKKAREAAERNFKKDIETYQNLVNELLVYEALTKPQPDTEKAKELLPKLKNLAKSRHALLWQRVGNGEEAIKLANEAVSSGKEQVLPLAAQVEILAENEKAKELGEAFEKLRTTGHLADLETPPLARLGSIASSLGLPEDWRTPPAPTDDLGERPDLDSLGPFRWSPPSAPSFSLKNEKGETVSLADYQGRPVLVIYFLGRGCTHCMEQLQAFTPFAEKYREAGIEIVTISTDTVEGIQETFQENEGEKSPFPFVMLSDHSLNHFKAYRAFDDFEDMALHGTYLIDGSQRIRWQDISYEPFMHPEWLLEECQRLLAIDEPES
ncbi:MAG: redoxin domain-containing protein [Verrucomicrobiales bacterium]|nr:redoxin domain-containing protein [Verrucomicrobiales bacterium]